MRTRAQIVGCLRPSRACRRGWAPACETPVGRGRFFLISVHMSARSGMTEKPRKTTKPQLALAIAQGDSVTAWPCTICRANMTHRPGPGLGNASGKSEDSLTSQPETAMLRHARSTAQGYETSTRPCHCAGRLRHRVGWQETCAQPNGLRGSSPCIRSDDAIDQGAPCNERVPGFSSRSSRPWR
jgi:hypothetical protein